jgi:hypothetical protein
MHTPAINPTDNELKQWVLAHSLFRPMTTQEVFERCTKAFDDAYASFPQANWATLAKNDILADMRRMQIQPTILEDYRRFVVLDSSSDPARYTPTDGVSWCFFLCWDHAKRQPVRLNGTPCGILSCMMTL